MTTDAPIEGAQGAPGLRLIAECSTRPLTHDDLALVGGFEAEDEPDTPEPTAAADTEDKTVLWQDEPTGGPDDTSEDEPPASVHAPAGASIFDLPRMAGRVVLASGSPRRVELLREIGFEPVVAPQDVDETPRAHEDPVELVRRLARLKAHSACDRNDATPGDLVIAADTTVWFEGTDLGKPSEAADACRMLCALSGRTHHVTTGVCLLRCDERGAAATRELSFTETSAVTFYELDDADIVAYVATGEPLDKAGAYGIQGLGRALVKGIEGDYYNVVGLPVSRLVREMARLLAS